MMLKINQLYYYYHWNGMVEGMRHKLEFGKLLSRRCRGGRLGTLPLDFKHVETDGFGEGTAFTNNHNISGLDANEARRTVCSQIGVAFFITVVLTNEVQIFPADDDGTLHLCRLDNSSENAPTNGDISCEGTLLVNICALYCFLGRLETKTNISAIAFDIAITKKDAFRVHKDGILLLEGSFGLFAYVHY